MSEIILNSYEGIVAIVSGFGFVAGVILTAIESFLPVLPLTMLIAINISSFGILLGYILSLIGTMLGSILVFIIFRKGFSNLLYKKIKEKEKLQNLMQWITSVKLTHLTLLIALPFTPSFLVNIAAGLSKAQTKKYLLGLIIGKIFNVYFWGYIGYNLIEVFNDPRNIVEIILILLGAYIISRYIGKKLNIE